MEQRVNTGEVWHIRESSKYPNGKVIPVFTEAERYIVIKHNAEYRPPYVNPYGNFTKLYTPDLSLLWTIFILLDSYAASFKDGGFLHKMIHYFRWGQKNDYYFTFTKSDLEYARKICQEYHDGLGIQIIDLISLIPEKARRPIFDNRANYEHLIVTQYVDKLNEYRTPYEPVHPIEDQAPAFIWQPSERLKAKKNEPTNMELSTYGTIPDFKSAEYKYILEYLQELIDRNKANGKRSNLAV